MAYSNTKNGTGIDSDAYIYVQLQVTRTDYSTYSHFELKSVAVSNTGSSSFIKGQVTTNQNGTSWTAKTGWKTVARNGTTLLAQSSFDVQRGTADKTAVCKAYAQGGGSEIYAGGEDTATLNVTVPRVMAPNAPSSAFIDQPWDDSSVKLYWTNGATSDDRPRDATLVERRTDDGSWVQIASVSGTASNYTDNSIAINHKYAFRMRAKNTAGYSSYVSAVTDVVGDDHIITTPAAPSNVTASLSSSSTVIIDATSNSPYAHGYLAQRTADGGQTWQDVGWAATLPLSDSAPAGTVQYRLNAFIDDRESTWAYSNELVTICPPLAPTITRTPPNPSVVNEASSIAWTPNHPDGSAQEYAQVKLTNPSGNETMYLVQSSNVYQFTPTASGTWTAQVRTKGIDPSWGAWSDAVSWGVYALPTVNIEEPASDSAVIDAMPLLVRWEASDETGISSQVVTIADSDGRKLYESPITPPRRYVYIGTQDISLANGGSYSATVTVMAGSGLKATAVRSFGISWTPPLAPTLDIHEAEGQSAEITVTFENGPISTRSVSVQRVYKGTVWTIAEDVSDGDTVRDPLPPLGTEVEYRGIAYATSGASAETSATVAIGGRAWALNFGNAAEECVELLYGRRNGRGLKHGGKSYHLADGGEGGGLPVFYPTTDRDQSGSLKFRAIYNDDVDRLFELCDAYPVGWIRDDRGRRWRAHIEPSEDYGDYTGPTYKVTVSWTADRWREAW